MAPPRHRRPGFSRRAQFGLFAGYVVAVAGVVVGLALVVIARFDPQGFALIRGGMLDASTPVTAAGRAAVREVAEIGDAIAAYVGAGTQNRALRAEIEIARIRLIAARATAFENRRLKALLHLRDELGTAVVATRVVGSTAAGSRRLGTITAGTVDGVAPGQPVRAPEGLVGRIYEVGRHAARVLLIGDPGSTVPVRLARGGAAALAVGRGDGTLRLRSLIAGAPAFRRGDLALTSGTGGLYPPGIPVAIVTEVDSDGAIAWPLADPARLDFALVLPVYAPPPPPPAASVAPAAAEPAP